MIIEFKWLSNDLTDEVSPREIKPSGNKDLHGYIRLIPDTSTEIQKLRIQTSLIKWSTNKESENSHLLLCKLGYKENNIWHICDPLCEEGFTENLKLTLNNNEEIRIYFYADLGDNPEVKNLVSKQSNFTVGISTNKGTIEFLRV